MEKIQSSGEKINNEVIILKKKFVTELKTRSENLIDNITKKTNLDKKSFPKLPQKIF